MIAVREATCSTLQKKIDALNQEAEQNRQSNPNLALRKARQAKDLAQHPAWGLDGYLVGIALSDVHQSVAHFALAHYESALKAGRSAEYSAEKINDPCTLAAAIGATGMAYVRLGNYSRALTYLHRQLTLAKDINDDAGVAAAHRGLTIVYGETEKFTESIHHAENSLKLLESLEDMRGLVSAHTNLCRGYAHKRQFEKSLTHGHVAVNLSRDYRPNLCSTAYSTLGFAYRTMSDYRNALKWFNLALNGLEEMQDSYQQSTALMDISETHFQLYDYSASQHYAEQAFALLQNNDHPWNLFRCHKLLSKLAEQRDDFEQSLYHYQQFQEIQSESVGEKIAEQMRYLRVSYEIDEAQRETERYRGRTQALEAVVNERTADLQQALEREQVALERERVLARDLAQALDEARTTNELRSNIISTVSHEFRTPLTVINTSADMLVLHADKINEKKRDQLYDRVKSSIIYLTALLEDAVLVETVNKDKMKVNSAESPFTDLCKQLEQEIMHMVGNPKNVSFHYEATQQMPVWIDKNLLRQIILNLLANAVKYSLAHLPIRVAFSVEPGWLTATVEDEGVGIAADEIGDIFNLFYRGNNAATRRGLGSGLYVASSLASVLEGSVSAESAGLNQGATFTVRVPITQPQPS